MPPTSTSVTRRDDEEDQLTSSTFLIRTTWDGRHYVDLLGPAQEVLFSSARHPSRSLAERAMQLLKLSAAFRGRYQCHQIEDNYYFVIRGPAGEPLGTSDRFASDAAREHAIRAVQAHAARAPVATKTPLMLRLLNMGMELARMK